MLRGDTCSGRWSTIGGRLDHCSVVGRRSGVAVQLLCCGHGLATSRSTSAWHGWSGGQKHMRSWPVSSPMSASSGEPGSHIRYSCTASALVRTPGVLHTSNGLPHLCGESVKHLPERLSRRNRNRVLKLSSSYRNPMVKHEPEPHRRCGARE